MTDIDLEDLYKMDAFGRLKFALAKDSIVARNWGDDKTAIDVTGDIETLIPEVERLRKELTTFYKRDNQEHRLIAKIERLEGEVEGLRELVEVQREYIQFLRDQPISGWTHIEAGKAIDFRLKIAEIEKEMG